MRSKPLDLRSEGPVTGLIYLLVKVSQFLSLSHWIIYLLKRVTTVETDSTNFDTWFFGIYVLAWLGALFSILAFAPLSGNIGLAFAALALYRLQDMLFGTIGDAFDFNVISGKDFSKVILAVLNVIQIVVIFAISYFVLVPNCAFTPTAPATRWGHFFLSWSSLPPLGNGYLAQTTRARSLAMVESGAGVVITIIALSRFLSGPEVPIPSGRVDAGGRSSDSDKIV